MGMYKRGRTYWISYSYKGKQYRESTGTDNKHFAQDLLAKRQAEIREQRLFDVKKGARSRSKNWPKTSLNFIEIAAEGRWSMQKPASSIYGPISKGNRLQRSRLRSLRTISNLADRSCQSSEGRPAHPRLTGSSQPSARYSPWRSATGKLIKIPSWPSNGY